MIDDKTPDKTKRFKVLISKQQANIILFALADYNDKNKVETGHYSEKINDIADILIKELDIVRRLEEGETKNANQL